MPAKADGKSEELSGTFQAELPTWEARFELKSLSAIEAAYRTATVSAENLESVRAALRDDLRAAGFEEVVAKCFRNTDPTLTVLGRRKNRDSVVYSLYWNAWSEKWEEAAVLARQSDARFAEEAAAVERLACLTER